MTRRLFHITIPKCGSQWVRDVLSSPDIWPDFKLTTAATELRYTKNRDLFNAPGNFFSPVYHLARHDWDAHSQNGDRGLIVIRDPRDRLVSLLFSHLYSHSGDRRIDAYREILFAQKSIQDILKLMIFTEGSHALYSFYIGWCTPLPTNCMLVRYEDLVADQFAGFQKIAEWSGLKYDKSALFASIQRHSFETRSGRSRGDEDKFSHYRMGIPGDWRNYFDQSIGQLWENLDPGIFRQIGYEESDAWPQSLPTHHENPIPELQVGADNYSAHLERERSASLRARVKLLEYEHEEKHKIIEELAGSCDERLAIIDQLTKIANERLALIHENGGRAETFRIIDELSKACNERLNLINLLSETANERLALIDSLQGTANDRLALIERLQRTAEERLALIETLQSVADERLSLIEALQVTADDRLKIIQSLSSQVKAIP